MTDEALELYNKYRDRYRILAEEFQKPKILEREKNLGYKLQSLKIKPIDEGTIFSIRYSFRF